MKRQSDDYQFSYIQLLLHPFLMHFLTLPRIRHYPYIQKIQSNLVEVISNYFYIKNKYTYILHTVYILSLDFFKKKMQKPELHEMYFVPYRQQLLLYQEI